MGGGGRQLLCFEKPPVLSIVPENNALETEKQSKRKDFSSLSTTYFLHFCESAQVKHMSRVTDDKVSSWPHSGTYSLSL